MMYTLKFFSPKPYPPERECEDAFPLCEVDKNERMSIFGVFDGVGASGLLLHKIDTDGSEHTSAHLGSNKTRNIIKAIWDEEHFEKIFDKEVSEIESFFEKKVFDELLEFANQNRLFDGITIHGKMFYLLPTTAAVTFCRKNSDERGETTSIDVICIWAGDSRCYSIDNTGLHQLTKDDQNTDSDAFESMINQPSMRNAIQINLNKDDAKNKQFYINCRKYTFTEPFIILCSTDGCYEYCGSPMHFEKAVLESILESIEQSQDIEEILKAKLNTKADDCTLSAGFFSFNANADEKKIICETFLERLKYLNGLIGNTSELQILNSEAEEIHKNIDENNAFIEKYRKFFTDCISIFPHRYDQDRSLDALLKDGTIEKELPGPFEEYNATISQNITLNAKISQIRMDYKEKLREIWYKSGYKEGYERIYNNGAKGENPAADKSNSSDDDSGRKGGCLAQNNGVVLEKTNTNQPNSSDVNKVNNSSGSSRTEGGETEETTPNKSNSFRDDSGRNNGKSKQSDGGKAEETPNGSNSSHEDSGNNKGASKQNDGGNAEETTLKKTKSSNDNLGGNSDRSAQNSGKKPETSQTISSQHSGTWGCAWCGKMGIPKEEYPNKCPICGLSREDSIKLQNGTHWYCKHCRNTISVKDHPEKCPVCGSDRYQRHAKTWTCKCCRNTISAKDHSDVCPNCGFIKGSNQNPLKIICYLLLSVFYKVRHIILKIANLILKTESKKSNDDKGGY